MRRFPDARWRRLAWILFASIAAMALAAWRAPRASFRFAVHTLDADARTLALAEQLGADTIVQLFSWRQIEPTRGQYHWQYPDEVIRGAAYHGLDVVVRIDQQPEWASPAGIRLNAPPEDPADYAAFVRAVARRYRGRVLAYIIWNEPNLAHEWGGEPPDPAGYVALLRAAYAAVKEADPDALVVSAGLAPTNDQGPDALDDRLYLQAMYAAGAAPFFDVLAAHPYGFAYPPDDPRGAHEGLNLARLLDLRDIMAANGDSGKPIWATEMGWTTEAVGSAAWQQVTPAQQAEYLVDAFRRARAEWPWLQLMAVWNLGGEDHPDWQGYSLLTPAGEPRPAFGALERMGRGSLAFRPARVRSRLRTSLLRRFGPPRHQILAEDSVVHLGDSDFGEPWMPLYGNRNPSSAWQGTFWMPDPGGRDWHLSLRVMQSNVWGNYVWINGHRLEPAFPVEDFSGAWVSQTWPVPPGLLGAGANEIRVTIGRTLPLVQVSRFAWDDLQIKDIELWHRGR